jgi:hypothetical protein
MTEGLNHCCVVTSSLIFSPFVILNPYFELLRRFTDDGLVFGKEPNITSKMYCFASRSYKVQDIKHKLS